MQVLRVYVQTSNALVGTRKTPPAHVAGDATASAFVLVNE